MGLGKCRAPQMADCFCNSNLRKEVLNDDDDDDDEDDEDGHKKIEAKPHKV